MHFAGHITVRVLQPCRSYLDATNGQMVATFERQSGAGSLWGVAWTPEDRSVIAGRRETSRSAEGNAPVPGNLQELPIRAESLQIGPIATEQMYMRLTRWFR